MQRARTTLVALVLAAGFVPAAPASAATIPCIDLGLVRAGDCDRGGSGTTGGSRTTASRCRHTDLLPTRRNLRHIRNATLCLLNGERRARGLPRLRHHSALRRAATSYARQMVRHRFFAHNSPGGSTMVSRVAKTSYLRRARSWSLGENLAWGAGERSTPGQTVKAWMESPGHRRNILTGKFRHIGIGVTTGAPQRGRLPSPATYVTEFGRRR